MSELKRCPFCGGGAEVVINTEMGGSQYQVKCKCCPVTVGRFWYWKKDDAIKAWNTRKPMERIVKRLKDRSNPTLLLSPSWLCKEERIMRFEGYRKGINEAIEIVKEEGLN